MSVSLDAKASRGKPAEAVPAVGRPAAMAAVRSTRWQWLVAVTVMCASVMDLLDSTIVNVAAPAIRGGLHASSTELQWILAGYTLAFAVALITGGRLGDVVGRRRMFLAGLAGFTAFSVACSLAVSPQMLVAARIAQGLAAAAMIPQGIAIVRSVFPPEKAAAVMGIFGPVMGMAALAGPIIGGALVSADVAGLGWRSVFWVNIPVGLAALAASARLPADRPGLAAGRRKLDTTGALLSTVAVLLVVYPLIQGRAQGWPPWTYASMGSSVLVFAAFAVHQRRRRLAGRTPLIEPSLFAKPGFVGGLVFAVAFFAAFIGGLGLIVTLRLQAGLGWSALQAGLAMVPFSVGAAVGAGLGGGLAPRFGRRVLHAGLAVMASGVAGLVLTIQHFGADLATWQLIPPLAAGGIGMGMLITTWFGIVLSAVDDAEMGSASGVMNAAQELGAAIGVAALGTVYFDRLAHQGSVSATSMALWLALALLIGCIGLGFLLPRKIRADVTEM